MSTAAASKRATLTESPVAALIALAALKKGEKFAGIWFDGKAWHGTVLLPGEMKGEDTWDNATAWAAKQGGELPTRREQSLLFANLRDEFKQDWYWSGEPHASAAGYAWCQVFDYGGQDDIHKGDELRARAVRRFKL